MTTENLEQQEQENGSEVVESQVTEQSQNPNSQGQPAGSVTPEGREFNDPRLKGKTTAEIEALLRLQDATIKSQGSRLNQQLTAPAENEQDIAEGITDEEVWKAPTRAFKTMLDRSVGKLREEIRGSINRVEAPSVRESFRSKTHFNDLEPAIDHFLTLQGIDPKTANEAQLKFAYHTTLGYALDEGLFAPSGRSAPVSDPNPNAAPTPVAAIPQHRPSSAPLPPSSSNSPKKRPLDENERRLAREYKMTEDQFRDWQDMEQEEVVSSKLGQEA